MSRSRLSMASSSSTKYDSYFMFDDGRRASVNNGWVWPQTPSYVYGSARRIIAVFLLNHLIVRASSKTIVGSSCEEHFTGGADLVLLYAVGRKLGSDLLLSAGFAKGRE